MSSGDSSSESVRGAGQPMGGRQVEERGQSQGSEQEDCSGNGKGRPGCFQGHHLELFSKLGAGEVS